MSRSSKAPKQGVLSVSSSNPAVGITVVGADLQTVGRGVGSVELKLDSGVYAARFRAGGSVREQTAVLGPGERVEMHEDGIAFATTAPLAGTRDGFETHIRAARDLSRQSDCSIGSDAGLFVFVRDVNARARTIPTRGLTLHRCDGEQLIDFAEHSHESRGDGPRWAGCAIELDPGTYRLRSSGGDGGTVEQAVIVARRWQTQVFLGRRATPRSGRGRRADLAGASVLMARDGFDPERGDLHAAEVARLGLRDRSEAVPKQALQGMLYGKWTNPMLGLYGAHLMINRPDPDLALLEEVATNLRRLLGDHPDVAALDLYLDDRAAPKLQFRDPPMLYSSWGVVVDKSVARPDLVPRDSLCAAISTRLLVGSPWLQWRPPRERRPVAAAPKHGEPGLGAALSRLAAELPDPETRTAAETAQIGPVEDMGGVARDVVLFAKQLSAQAWRSDESPSSIVDDGEVVRALGVPRAVAEDAVDLVYDRLVK